MHTVHTVHCVCVCVCVHCTYTVVVYIQHMWSLTVWADSLLLHLHKKNELILIFVAYKEEILYF